MLKDFVGNIKQQMFYQLWKFKLDTMMINHSIYMVWSPGAVSVEFRDVPQRHCFSMLLSTFLYTLGQVHKVKYQLTIFFFFMNIKFNELLSKIGNVLQVLKI